MNALQLGRLAQVLTASRALSAELLGVQARCAVASCNAGAAGTSTSMTQIQGRLASHASASTSASWSHPMGSQGPSFAVLGLQQHQRQASRSMAKSAAGGKGGEAGAGAGKGARKRRGWFKLWSVNNHRLRFPHEQIWPTLKLTDEQAAEFRRNSRLFVVDLGRTITLKNKFSMNNAAAGGERPSPSVAYSLLHETNMHLDAVGEHPRYLKVRRVKGHFAHQLQSLRKLRVLLGFQRRHYVQNLYEQSLTMKGADRQWKLICAAEAKLSLFALRMGLAEDIVGAQRAVEQDRIHVNGAPMPMKYAGYVQPGDILTPGNGSTRFFQDRVARSLAPLIVRVDAAALKDRMDSVEQFERFAGALGGGRGGRRMGGDRFGGGGRGGGDRFGGDDGRRPQRQLAAQ